MNIMKWYVLTLCVTLTYASDACELRVDLEQEEQLISRVSVEEYYGKHILAGLVAQLTHYMMSEIGLSAVRSAASLKKTSENDVIPNLAYSVAWAARLSAVFGGLYLIYHTPQLADTYLLQNDIVRTTKQNVAAFIANALVGWPIGTLFGEFISGRCTPAPEMEVTRACCADNSFDCCDTCELEKCA